jgi:predicted TIM-barrel fold metal-dependent hydrolase
MSEPGGIAALDGLDAAGLDAAERHAILAGNAARILGAG